MVIICKTVHAIAVANALGVNLFEKLQKANFMWQRCLWKLISKSIIVSPVVLAAYA